MMKLRLGVCVLAVLLPGGLLVGQDTKKVDDPPPPIVIKGTLPAHWKSLGLDTAQKKSVYKVKAKYEAKIEALRQQILDLQAEEKVELEKILTDAQKARLKEIKLGETKTTDPEKKPTESEKKPTDTEKKGTEVKKDLDKK